MSHYTVLIAGDNIDERMEVFDEGLEVHHDGDLPARSGLGSSSAFAVGILHALYALKGKMLTS